jgi:hypothetical protein
MILFNISFPYKELIIEGQVHELESHPKQWLVSVNNDQLDRSLNTTHIITYDYKNKEYQWGFPPMDKDHTFMNNMAMCLRDYLLDFGWDSVHR